VANCKEKKIDKIMRNKANQTDFPANVGAFSFFGDNRRREFFDKHPDSYKSKKVRANKKQNKKPSG